MLCSIVDVVRGQSDIEYDVLQLKNMVSAGDCMALITGAKNSSDY